MPNDDGLRPAKRLKMLSDDEDSDNAGDSILSRPHLTVNREYAQRFEHNKKRDEFARLEEKFKRQPGHTKSDYNIKADANGEISAADSLTESDSTSESEDDEGELVTQALDSEINATLRAIRSKDPRVYDKQSTFYKASEVDNPNGPTAKQHKNKPVFVQDYHRRNLMSGVEKAHEAQAHSPLEDQDEKQKQALIREMHKPKQILGESASDVEDDDFFVAKEIQKPPRPHADTKRIEPSEADKDPETFLSNFMESRAWVPQDKAEYHPFDSDESDEDAKADEFEEAYNLRFEDPTRSNEKLLSHSRQAAAQHSVRREELKGRKRARDAEREQKEAMKREREEEKARLRNLRVEQAAAKLKQFKEASGLRGEALPVEDWQKFLDAGWASDTWDQEMSKRFGDQYYAAKAEDASDEGAITKSKSKSLQKPKWDDDIDIDDIVPDFDAAVEHSQLALTDDEDNDAATMSQANGDFQSPDSEDMETTTGAKPKGTRGAKDPRQLRAERKKEARKERRKLEEAVEQNMVIDTLPKGATKKPTGPFRYRDTSPSAFGLNARDILMAEDSSLNQYAGLKKLATFRDLDKKQKDKRKLSKKARLRQWRKETFGDENGPYQSLSDYIKARMGEGTELGTAASKVKPIQNESASLPASEKKKSKKRSRKKATTTAVDQ